MRRIIRILKSCIAILPLVLAACAITDVSSSTPPPALTLNAPPSLNFSDTCDHTKALENWLQITTGLVASFQTKMNEAAGKTPNEAYQSALDLLAIRDAAYGVVTPDCANNLELVLSDAMNQGVIALQQYVNGTQANISSTLADVNSQLDQVTQSQNELIQRLENQIQQQAQQAAATPTP